MVAASTSCALVPSQSWYARTSAFGASPTCLPFEHNQVLSVAQHCASDVVSVHRRPRPASHQARGQTLIQMKGMATRCRPVSLSKAAPSPFKTLTEICAVKPPGDAE